MPAGLDKGLVAVRNAGDATNRLFLLEQDGQVWAWDGDQVHSTPFLDIKSEVTLDQYSGLFGLVFHPDYATNGHFFVNYTYTTDSGAERMRTERFTVLADDPNLADLATRRVIIEYENNNGHHNGGDIAFGPDGFLYIAMGDSGGQEDPF
jgi:glucose/arabinose dehydrogenase